MSALVSLNPARGFERNGEVTCSTEAEVRAAVRACASGLRRWALLPLGDRMAALRPLPQLLLDNREDLAALITREMGKPIRESRQEVDWSAEELVRLSECAPGALEDVELSIDGGNREVLRRQPWGVAAVLSPWNYPLEIALWGIVPTLLAGNTVVFKPSEVVPMLSQRLARLLADLALPAGVFETVFGGPEVGRALVRNDDVALVWFTGSTRAGKQVYRTVASRFGKALLELGGSSPTIVFRDANVDDEMIDSIVRSRFANCGQVCSATKRLFVDEEAFDDVMSRLVARVELLRVGDPFCEETEVSSLASLAQLRRLESQVRDAVQRGAVLHCGGRRLKADGAYFAPTILSQVPAESRVMREEVFGPVLPVATFRSEEQAIALANATVFGLSAHVYTADSERAMRIAGAIDAGRITVNTTKHGGVLRPFGGFKRSGVGRQHGVWGFQELTQLKYVCACI